MKIFFILCLFFCNAIYAEIKAIIFDCDGTLVDSEIIQYHSWAHAFGNQGYLLLKEEYVSLLHEHHLVGLPSANKLVANIGASLIGRDCSKQLLKDMNERLEELRVLGFPPIEATVAFLHQLAAQKKSLGIKLGVASGAKKEQILKNLRNLDIEKYFDTVVSGSEDVSIYIDLEGTNKPKPYVYMIAAKNLGVMPTECIAIEDSQTGVLSSSTAGCITIAIPNEYTCCQDFSKADFILKSLSDYTPIDLLHLQNLVNCPLLSLYQTE